MQEIYRQVDPAVSAMVSDTVAARGIPTTLDAANDLADDLYPVVLEQRGYLAAREKSLILQEHPLLTVPDSPAYPLTAIRKLVYRAAGLQPVPQLADVEVFDQKTQSMQRMSVPPWVYPGEERMLEEFNRRLAAASGRHSRQASRSVVLLAAKENKVRWARQLAGAENCGFCAMLVGRGAVYTKKTARFLTHDNCDCTATIVENNTWRGEEESDRLYDLWLKSGNNLTEFTKLYRELQDNEQMAA